jgi:hypothetical protein
MPLVLLANSSFAIYQIVCLYNFLVRCWLSCKNKQSLFQPDASNERKCIRVALSNFKRLRRPCEEPHCRISITQLIVTLSAVSVRVRWVAWTPLCRYATRTAWMRCRTVSNNLQGASWTWPAHQASQWWFPSRLLSSRCIFFISVHLILICSGSYSCSLHNIHVFPVRKRGNQYSVFCVLYKIYLLFLTNMFFKYMRY